jgi:ribosomal protein S18 acetylase RimI-like enzyme
MAKMHLMEFFIRPAGPADAEEIAEVQRISWRMTYDRLLSAETLAKAARAWDAGHWRRALERTDDRVISLVLESRQTGIIGFGVAGPRRNGRDPLLGPYTGEIYLLYLMRDYQRHGHGARLIAALARVLRARGMGAAVVWALADNQGAIGFYEHLAGEMVTQCRKPFFGETVNEVAIGWRDIAALANLTPRLRG